MKGLMMRNFTLLNVLALLVSFTHPAFWADHDSGSPVAKSALTQVRGANPNLFGLWGNNLCAVLNGFPSECNSVNINQPCKECVFDVDSYASSTNVPGSVKVQNPDNNDCGGNAYLGTCGLGSCVTPLNVNSTCRGNVVSYSSQP
jgi:hypothetical protein